MGLTALEIERAKAGAKLYRLYDGAGLFIEITLPAPSAGGSSTT